MDNRGTVLRDGHYTGRVRRYAQEFVDKQLRNRGKQPSDVKL